MELENYNEKLNFLSYTDELTGLYNRRGFYNFSEKCLELYSGMKKTGCLFFADMDGLKKINDTFGHEEGDIAIQSMAAILQEAFRKNDIVCRLGGDEFVILSIVSNDFKEEIVQERIKRLVNIHNEKSKKPYYISISVGSVIFQTDDKKLTLDHLLSQADNLLYEQKERKHSKGASNHVKEDNNSIHDK